MAQAAIFNYTRPRNKKIYLRVAGVVSRLDQIETPIRNTTFYFFTRYSV